MRVPSLTQAMQAISVKGVAAGAAVDILLTNVFMIPLAVAIAAAPEIQQLSPDKQGAAIVAAMMASSSLFTGATILGSLASICGGWVAAAIAKRSETLNGAVSAIACVGLGIYGWISDAGTMSPAVHAGFLVLSPVLGFTGGAIRRARHRATAARSADASVDAPPLVLRGWQRALLFFDRAMIGVGVLGVLFFLLASAVTDDSTAKYAQMGALIIAGYAAILSLLAFAAARALQRNNPFHWRYRTGVFVLSGCAVVLFAWSATLAPAG